MRNKPLRAGGRSIGLLVLAVLIAGVAGSILSYFLAGLFPAGPVRDFFFKAVNVGVPTVTLNVGFAQLTFGLSFAVTTFTVILLLLTVYLWFKF